MRGQGPRRRDWRLADPLCPGASRRPRSPLSAGEARLKASQPPPRVTPGGPSPAHCWLLCAGPLVRRVHESVQGKRCGGIDKLFHTRTEEPAAVAGEEGTPIGAPSRKTARETAGRSQTRSAGRAQTMRGAALEANWRPNSPRPGAKRDAAGHALVTRNGHARKRLVPTVAPAGAICVDDRRVEETTRRGGSSPLRSSHPLSSVPEGERGPPAPLPAWTYDRGRGPLSRGRLRLVGRALLGDHPAAEVPAGRDRAFSAVTERTSTRSTSPPIESGYVRLADERLDCLVVGMSRRRGALRSNERSSRSPTATRSRPTRRPVSSGTDLPPTPP